MGAALVTILLGPWAGVLVLTCVVSIQALIFQDGGLLALGANIFNMGVIGVFVAYMTYRTIRRLAGDRPWALYVAGFTAAWLSVEVAALAVALQLAFSGTSPANLAIPAMAGVHALIGIGEGFITVGALAFVHAARPDLLKGEQHGAVGGSLVWGGGLLLALGLAVASPLASAHPDGLERVAEQKGFLNLAQGPLYKLIPNYTLPSMANGTLATILAGVLGTLLVFVVALAVANSRRNRSNRASS
jgi:cobalt/nickel transport system permease protein